MTRSPLHIVSSQGLGDNVFQRPFVRALAERWEVYIQTSWPEIYQDLPVHFVRPTTRLRTQLKNINRQPPSRWCRPPPPPPHCPAICPFYTFESVKVFGSVIAAIEAHMPLDGAPYINDLPDFGPSPITADKPIAVVRPVTVRSEWTNLARNPDPAYIAYVADHLRATHHVVVVADLAPGLEWQFGELPPADETFLKGEFDVTRLLALVAGADVVVGGPGWLVPAALAYRVPMILINGGMASINAFDKISDARMDRSRVHVVEPENFCQCTNHFHDCDKTISPERLSAAVRFAKQLPRRASPGFPKSASATIPSASIHHHTTKVISTNTADIGTLPSAAP